MKEKNVCTEFIFIIRFYVSGLSTATTWNVSLQVDPPSVRRGQHATFICTYDLESKLLYTVKFYRGNFEFYRYSPKELPIHKRFELIGINVDVSTPKQLDHLSWKKSNLRSLLRTLAPCRTFKYFQWRTISWILFIYSVQFPIHEK